LVFGDAEGGDEGEEDVFACAGDGSESLDFVVQIAVGIEKMKSMYSRQQ
jgi:hypothetical protein